MIQIYRKSNLIETEKQQFTYKQKATRLNNVTNGKADIVDSSHFSSNLLTLQENILV